MGIPIIMYASVVRLQPPHPHRFTSFIELFHAANFSPSTVCGHVPSTFPATAVILGSSILLLSTVDPFGTGGHGDPNRVSRSTARWSLHTCTRGVTDPHVHYWPMERPRNLNLNSLERHCSASTVRIKWTAHLFRHLIGAIARRTSPLVPAHRLGTFDQR